MYSAQEDTKVEFISEDIEAFYFKYTKDADGVCTAGTQQTYKSGDNLLMDYDQVCGYSIYVQNIGNGIEKINVYIKGALYGIAPKLMLLMALLTLISIL